jgi:hypothetical protein
MNKEQFELKINAMMPELTEAINKECSRLFSCGGIDTNKYEDNFLLPKIILTVAIENQAFQYRLPSGYKSAMKEINNLKHF